MSWTTPIDWGEDDIPTPSQFNEQIRDNQLYLKGIVDDSLRVRKFTIYHDRVEPDLRRELGKDRSIDPIVWRVAERTIITDIAAHVTVPWDVGPTGTRTWAIRFSIYRGSADWDFARIWDPTSVGWLLMSRGEGYGARGLPVTDKGMRLYRGGKRRLDGISHERNICVSGRTENRNVKPTQGEMEVYLFYVEVE